MLQLSPRAAAALSEAQRTQGIPDSYCVRVYGSPAPEAGTALHIAFVEGPQEGDEVTTQGDLQVSVDPEIVEPLSEAFIDLEEAEQGARLVLKGVQGS